MFVGVVRSKKKEEYSFQTDNFSEAWKFCHETTETLASDTAYAAVHETVKWSDGKNTYCSKEIAVMRTLK